MGTNKRYEEPERAWVPPWPPVQISDCEWVVIRNYPDSPAALIRRLDATFEHTTYFRVVTWRPTSAGRQPIGRFASLKEADCAVFFEPENGATKISPPNQMWAHQRSEPRTH